ncbi:MAG: branched-chain amino acid transport system II carrier protein [Methanobacterium sp.]
MISNFGLGSILAFSRPFINAAYPALIMLIICNLAYKIWGFKPVKLPVFITLIISCILFLR